MNLFFIYDTTISNPDDDPSKAMVYFYPAKELDSEKLTLCCQIVGVARFLKAAFSSPSVITLDSGGFAFCQSENYLLVLGGTKLESNQSLKMQLRLLYKMFTFYHSNINQVFHICNGDKQSFLKRMNKIWSQCLSVLRQHQDVMQLSCYSLPVTIFSDDHHPDLKSSTLLTMCQEKLGVLAGAVFCQKKLLYSQLSPDVTGSLLLVASQENPLGINVQVKYWLPPGIKLKYVYLNQKEVKQLQKYKTEKSVKDKRSFQSLLSNPGSEGDVDSDCHSRELRRGSNIICALNAFKLGLHYHYFEDLLRLGPVNLPCSSHRMKVPLKELLPNNGVTTPDKTTRDLEFQCYLCAKMPEHLVLSRLCFLTTLKRSNSETDIMCLHNQQYVMSQSFTEKCSVKKPLKAKSKQKHRKSSSSITLKHSKSSSSQEDNVSKTDSPRTNSKLWTDVFYSPFSGMSHTKESIRYSCNPLFPFEDLHQECVLYIQNYEDCLLVLLLNSVPPKNILIYLWHCGFSVLPSIACNMRTKQHSKSFSPNDRSDFNIYTHKYKSRLLHGKLSLPNIGVVADSTKSAIHEDFYAHPLLYSVSIMESRRSICAYNTKEKQIFYEQAGSMHRKSSWFSQLWEKANKRTEKYLNMTLPKI